jgi:hypothetical protein
MLRFSEGEDPDPSRDSPFSKPYCSYRVDALKGLGKSANEADKAVNAFLQKRYFGTPDMPPATLASMTRRRIDTDWLAPASALALKLDSDTNNTSLVLAFELPDGTVMLFAADAQVGNWESWHDQTYGVDEEGTGITAENLLNRTRLYKVGHHGSHNATLKDRGLAMMIHDELVVMIPTDEEFGKRQGSSGWQMPNPRVRTALRERSKGRILRNDRLYSPEARAADAELRGVDPGFFDKLKETPLYLEYRLL